MKRIIQIISIMILANLPLSHAWGNGFLLNSVGTRAMAMGGAFVGLADDLSAMYWNPAGIARIRATTFTLSAGSYSPSADYDWDSLGIRAENLDGNAFKGLAAVAFPITERWTTGLALYSSADFRTEWSGQQIAEIFGDMSQRDRKNHIGFYTLAAAAGWQVNEKFSLGASLELHYGRYDNEQYLGYIQTGAEPHIKTIYMEYLIERTSGIGLGGTLGLQYRPSDQLSLGLAVRTPGRMWFKGKGSSSNIRDLESASDLKRNLALPLCVRGGVAFKPVPALTLTADIHYSFWSTLDAITEQYVDPLWDMTFVTSSNDKKILNWKNTLQLRLGMEYQVGSLALRAGFFTDPAVSPDSTINLMFYDVSQNFITAGLGLNGKAIRLYGVHFDFGFEYGLEGSRNIPEESVLSDPAFENAVPGTYRQQELRFALAFSYRF